MTGWRALGVGAALLVARSAGATAAWVDEVVDLGNPAQVHAVCQEVGRQRPNPRAPGAPKVAAASHKAALERIYTAVVPGDAYQFTQLEEEPGQLKIPTDGGFHVQELQSTLWSTYAEPLEISLTQAGARAAMATKKRGELVLKLYFHFDADPDEPMDGPNAQDPCAQKAGQGGLALAVTWLGGELLDTKLKKSMASFATPAGHQTPEVAQRLLGDASLKVGDPESAAESFTALQSWLKSKQAALHGCHVKHGGHAEGGLVLALDVNPKGGVAGVSVEVDSLSRDDVGPCVVAVVRGAKDVPKLPAGAHVTVPLMWARD